MEPEDAVAPEDRSARSWLPKPATVGTASVLVLLAALRLYLTAPLPTLETYSPVDDTLYLTQAFHLANGEWLGPYDETTLVKAPGYAFLLAGARRAGIPRRVAEDVVLLAAALVLFGALRRLGMGRALAAGAYAACLFSPGVLSDQLYRPIREHLYVSQTILVLALGLGVVAARLWWSRLLVSAVLGLVLAWFWVTRDEGIWIVPSLAVLGLALILLDRSRGRKLTSAVGLAVASAAVASSLAWVGPWAVGRMNDLRYGHEVVSELREPSFVAAVAALNRVARAEWQRFEPLTPELRERLYEVSPAMASLRGVLDDAPFHGSRFEAANDERMALYRMWALRVAVARIGEHPSPERASRFYRRLADEIEAACDAEEIPCGDPRPGLLPAFHPSLYGTVLRELRDALASAWRGETGGAHEGNPYLSSRVPEGGRPRVRELIGEPAHHRIGASVFFRHHLLHFVFLAARRLQPILLGLGGAALALSLFLWTPRSWIGWLVSAVMLAAVASRAALLALVETYWWPGTEVYLLCVYPLLPVAAFAALQTMVVSIEEYAPARSRRTRLVTGGALSLALVLLAAGLLEPEWHRAGRGRHPGVPVDPYGRLETEGGRVFLRRAELVPEPTADLVVRSGTGGPLAELVVRPLHPQMLVELEIRCEKECTLDVRTRAGRGQRARFEFPCPAGRFTTCRFPVSPTEQFGILLRPTGPEEVTLTIRAVHVTPR